MIYSLFIAKLYSYKNIKGRINYMIKTEFMELLEELDNLYEDTDSVDAIIAEIEAGAKALLQSSPLQEATELDLDIDNNDIEAAQAELDKDWKKSKSWIERVKTWFAEKVLKYVLKNEKVYDALITYQFEGNIVESYLVDITYDLQQIHWDQLEEVAIKNAAKNGVDTSNLALKVISKDNWYSQEKFFVQVLKLIRSGAVKDIYEAVRALDLELFDYKLVSKELLEELDSLYEAPDLHTIYASKTFWADAKAGKLNDLAFKKAFKDELVALDLWSLIDEEYYSSSRFYTPTHTGVLKDKSSYGAIKKAADKNPDSWAVKALLKMWVLQFKDGVKSNTQLKKERMDAAEEERKIRIQKEREENEVKEAAYKAAEKEFKDTYLQEVTDTVNKVAADFAPKAYATAKTLVEKIIKLADDTKALSKGLVVAHSMRDEKAFLNLAEDDIIKMHCRIAGNSSYPYYPSNPEFKIRVEVFKFLNVQDERLRSYARKAEVGYDYVYCYLRQEDFTEELITKKVLEMLKPLSEVILADFEESVTWRQENFDKLNKKVTAAKNAQAAADAGKPVDPNFSKDILSLFEKGLKDADRSANIWSDSTSDNQAVAYILGLHDSVQEIAPALLYCNWRAVRGDQEVASWRMTESIRNLEDAITDAIDVFKRDNSLTIEVIKN